MKLSQGKERLMRGGNGYAAAQKRKSEQFRKAEIFDGINEEREVNVAGPGEDLLFLVGRMHHLQADYEGPKHRT